MRIATAWFLSGTLALIGCSSSKKNSVTPDAAEPSNGCVIDDSKGVTVASASTLEKAMREELKTGANVEAARRVGKEIAERAKKAGIDKVVFDRGGFLYHGRIKALADAAREAGLKF